MSMFSSGAGLLSGDMSLTLGGGGGGSGGNGMTMGASSSSSSDWANVLVSTLDAAGRIVPALAGDAAKQARAAQSYAQAEQAKLGQLQLQVASQYAQPGGYYGAQQSAGPGVGTWVLIGVAALGGVLLLSTLTKPKEKGS